MLHETNTKVEDKRQQRRDEAQRVREQLQQSSRDLLVLFRWPLTIVAAIYVCVALYDLVHGRRNGWVVFCSCFIAYEAWRGWHFFRQRSKSSLN
jgi:hypothetical protein